MHLGILPLGFCELGGEYYIYSTAPVATESGAATQDGWFAVEASATMETVSDLNTQDGWNRVASLSVIATETGADASSVWFQAVTAVIADATGVTVAALPLINNEAVIIDFSASFDVSSQTIDFPSSYEVSYQTITFPDTYF